MWLVTDGHPLLSSILLFDFHVLLIACRSRNRKCALRRRYPRTKRRERSPELRPQRDFEECTPQLTYCICLVKLSLPYWFNFVINNITTKTRIDIPVVWLHCSCVSNVFSVKLISHFWFNKRTFIVSSRVCVCNGQYIRRNKSIGDHGHSGNLHLTHRSSCTFLSPGEVLLSEVQISIIGTSSTIYNNFSACSPVSRLFCLSLSLLVC